MTAVRTKWFALAFLAALAPAAVAGPPGLEPRPSPPPHVIEEVRSHEAEILSWVQEHDPDSYQRLMRLRERDPGGYIGHLVRVSRMMQRSEADPEVVERHRAMKELEREIRSASAGWEALEAKEQKTRRAELEELAGKLLELKQAERRARLEEIRARAAELEAEIEERDQNRKDVIGAWLDDLLDEGPPDL